MKKHLGIDYGSKRVGVAVSDVEGMIAFPRTTIKNDQTLVRYLLDLIRKENIDVVVVGDTRSHGGAENPVTPEAEAFVVALERETKLSIKRVWETWSSIEASRYVSEGRAHDDSSAAAVILQRYLDIHSNRVE